MSDRPKDRPSEEPFPLELDLGELPPLDDGDLEPDAAAETAGAVGAEDPEDDGALGLEDPAADLFADALAEFEEAVAEEGGGEDGGAPISADEIEEEEGWAEGAEPAAPLDDPWFDEHDEGDGTEEDDGAEGPVGGAEDAQPDDLPETDAAYLGPVRGRAVAVAVVGGALLAVGDGLYRVGADGLLHRFDTGEDLDAVSVLAVGGRALVGTERQGLLRLDGIDGAPGPCGVRLGSGRANERALSGAFVVVGAVAEHGAPLLALAEDGELLASDDGGETWRSALPGRRCLAATPWEGDAAILALVDGEGGPALLRGDERGEWRCLAGGCPLTSADRAAGFSIVAAGGVIGLGSDRAGAPLFVSIDGGARFAELRSVTGVTALAVDAHEPGWIAAATWSPVAGTGTVRASRDGGKSWRVAFTTGGAEEREEPVSRPGRVSRLAVIGGVGGRRLVAVTAEGVYAFQLEDRAATQ
jgi:hypothetical protein